MESQQPVAVGQFDVENQQNPPTKSCCCKVWGWCWSDWSQVVGRLGLVGGIGTGIYGLAAQNPYIVAAAVLGVVAGYLFPDLRLSCLSSVIDLGHNVENFHNENEHLDKEENNLTDQVKKLNSIKQQLEKTLELAQKENAELRESLSDKTASLESTAKNLALTAQKLEVVEKLYYLIKSQTQIVSKNINAFNLQNKIIKGNSKNLSNDLNNLDEENKSLFQDLGEFNSLNKIFDSENQKLQQMLNNFGGGIETLQNEFKSTKQTLEELKEREKQLSQTEGKLSVETQKLDKLAAKNEELLEGFKNALNNTADINDSSEN